MLNAIELVHAIPRVRIPRDVAMIMRIDVGGRRQPAIGHLDGKINHSIAVFYDVGIVQDGKSVRSICKVVLQRQQLTIVALA